MMQTSIVIAFPGQGIQKPGMASALMGTQAWRLFGEASEIVGYDLGALCLDGPEERLQNTAFAQVAIFVTCLALWDLVKERYKPQLFLGHSLGELTALCAAGAFSFGDGVSLVAKRGRFMANLAKEGGMAAVLGLELEAVEELCAEVSRVSYVQVANENSPGQVVVSGELQGLQLVARLAKERGAKRVVPLNVSGPFHSRLMEEAANKFGDAVEQLSLTPCHTPVLSNDGNTLLQEPGQVQTALVNQITDPVRFVPSIQRAFELGVKNFVEVSPEPILTALARRIEPNLQFTLVRDGGM